MKTIIHHGFSRRWLGVGMSLVAAVAAQAQTLVTFQVDMTPYTGSPNPPSTVTINGSFNGWSGPALINVSGNIWSNTISISDPPGTVEQCKFVADGNYEPLAANREFLLGPVSPPTQVEPLEEWGTNDWPAPTNQVTFQVDMSAQVALGNFTNGDPTFGVITVSGDFEGWDSGDVLTNNPTLSGSASNVYSGTFPAVGFPGGTTINYKFRMNGGWESPASTGGNNRAAAITNSTQILPLVYYNDNSIYDLVLSPITVTFSIVVTNGTLDDGGYAFEKGTDQIYVNGDWLGWPSWGLDALPATQQMIEVGTGDIYTNSFVIPRGNSIYINYKYSFDGFDDENGFGTNHVREIRSYGPTYAFPQDVWSWTLAPSNTLPTIVEQDFGNLAIGTLSGGNVPITWLGRPGVVLQNEFSLTGGTWTTNNGTDGTQSTNWPNAGSSQFFRLLKKQ
jgi:hypothetical protein